LTIGTLLVQSWYTCNDWYAVGTNSVPIVKNSQRQSKDSQNSKNDH